MAILQCDHQFEFIYFFVLHRLPLWCMYVLCVCRCHEVYSLLCIHTYPKNIHLSNSPNSILHIIIHWFYSLSIRFARSLHLNYSTFYVDRSLCIFLSWITYILLHFMPCNCYNFVKPFLHSVADCRLRRNAFVHFMHLQLSVFHTIEK